MDFFEAQEQARRRTKWLMLWFVLAILLVVALVNVLAYYLLGGRFGENESTLVSTLTVGIILAGSGFKSMQLNGGGAVVAHDLGGRLILPGSTDFHEKRLLNVVEEMAIASGMPVPQVYVMDDEEGINAFAAGTEPSNAIIGVTRGCLLRLSRDELSGVVAHEFSHILNGDMRLNMRLIGLVFGLLILSIIGRTILESLRYQSVSRRNSKEVAGVVLVVVALGLGLLVIGGVGAFFGQLIQAAVSRQREFLADASAVQFTRNPGGITGALKKIGGLSIGSKMRSAKATEASHLFFSSGGMFSFGMATHPPLETRILAVEESWDGRFVSSEIAGSAEREETWKPKKDPRLDGLFKEMTVAVALDQLSAGERWEVARGGRIRDGLSEAWREAGHDREEAQALIFGLLLAEDDQLRQREARFLEEKAGREGGQAALRWREELRGLHSSRKIALLEIALPTLRSLSDGEYRRFREVSRWLIASDGQVDLFEFMLERVISRHLGSHFDNQGFRKIRYRVFDHLLKEGNLLVSAFAGIGSREGALADAAHAVATRVWPGSFKREQISSLEQLGDALDQFDQASPLVKRQLLVACGKAVAHDGKITSEEAELLRAVADSIGCPVPPFAVEVEEGEI
jgi:Zn-dependent protease with chaperone function